MNTTIAWFKASLRFKLFAILFLTALVPFSIANVYWYQNAQDTVRKDAQKALTVAADQSEVNLNNWLNTKLLGFLSHSQGAAMLSGNESLIEEDLSNFLLQDPDIISLSYVDNTGQERVKVTTDKNRNDPINQLKNLKDTPQFKVPDSRYGNQYIGSPGQTAQGLVVEVATPIVYPQNSQSLRTFSSVSQQPRYPGDVFGVLVGQVSLTKFSQNLTSLNIGNGGYIYVVDDQGNIIMHKNSSLLGKPVGNSLMLPNPLTNPAKDTTPTQATSIDGQTVMRTIRYLSRTGWTLAAEEPVSLISADVVRIQAQTIPLFLLPLLLVVVLSLLFSHTLTAPIKQMVQAAVQIGQGNFDVALNIRSHDELEHLGQSYNDMAKRLKEDRQAILNQRNTLSTVLDSAVEGVIGLDQQGSVLFANTAAIRMIGLPAGQVEQKPLDAIVTFTSNSQPVEAKHLYLDGQARNQRLAMASSVNSINVSLTSAKVSDASDSPIRYIISLYDITKEQELEDMKLDFVSMAAHELRTPLTAMKGYLSIYIDENSHISAKNKEYLDRINQSALRLSALVESILRFSRIERRDLHLDKQLTDWPTFLRQSVADVANLAQAKRMEITIDLPQSLPEVSVDAGRMAEVMANLLSNAIKYTPDHGHIAISAHQEDGKLITSVADDGPGIPDDSQPHLFSKFYRVPGHLEQTVQGTGLGLYITKRIIELHQGKIWFESKPRHTVFSFALPLSS